jgi:NADH-quinone oxidoreductase subunit N
MNLGAFQLGGLIGHQAGTDDIRSWREQIQLSPLLTIALVVFMIALTGLPPTAGFTGKLNLLLPLWSAYQGGAGQLYLVLMIGLILNTVLSLFFYLRVPGLLLLRRDPPQAAQPLRIHLSNAILQGLLAAALLYLGLFHFDALVSYLSNLL